MEKIRQIEKNARRSCLLKEEKRKRLTRCAVLKKSRVAEYSVSLNVMTVHFGTAVGPTLDVANWQCFNREISRNKADLFN